jgi:hypothetical protein
MSHEINKINRRAFGISLMGGALTAGKIVHAQAQTPTLPQTPPQEEARDYPAPTFKPKLRKPRLGSTLAQDFVIFGHYDLDMVKKLLEKEPAVLNATVDWGGGDWESAMGGASHMGRRDIAAFLIEKGARPDIFTAAMLGHLDVVKSLLTFHPTLADAKGPHGIPLLAHAKMGGKEAEAVFNYLEGLKRV